ncbi:MAG: AbrB/MazE/SpoVT family DNA-binding domain-containing protein [Candidatus Kerfeldbacteria bacterium]|nr:AbrB/MazE/SpoVT family DNA-binding domain-containing protein [Candidatus Kerfeldbacteria bacterium]
MRRHRLHHGHGPTGPGHRHFFGTTTLGEKGQVVIPAEARKALKLKNGEKLLVFGFGDNMIALSKFDGLEKFVAHLSHKLDSLREIMKKESRT